MRGQEFAWLIFGYDEKKHAVVGASFKDGEGALNKLKHDFSHHTTDGQTFREIVPNATIDESWRMLIFSELR